MKVRMDRTGQRFGNLIVLSLDSIRKRESVWLVQCDCGKTSTLLNNSLVSGKTRSCGCLVQAPETIAKRAAKRVTHGLTNSTTYYVYQGCIQRCHNPRAPAYAYYGGRGIQVCGRWRESFQNFLQDMGERPEGKTLDRIDPNGDYSPANCRWADWETQGNNRRNVKLLEMDGIRRSVAQWARSVGLHEETLRKRLRHGETLSNALRPVERKAA